MKLLATGISDSINAQKDWIYLWVYAKSDIKTKVKTPSCFRVEVQPSGKMGSGRGVWALLYLIITVPLLWWRWAWPEGFGCKIIVLIHSSAWSDRIRQLLGNRPCSPVSSTWPGQQFPLGADSKPLTFSPTSHPWFHFWTSWHWQFWKDRYRACDSRLQLGPPCTAIVSSLVAFCLPVFMCTFRAFLISLN